MLHRVENRVDLRVPEVQLNVYLALPTLVTNACDAYQAFSLEWHIHMEMVADLSLKILNKF